MKRTLFLSLIVVIGVNGLACRRQAAGLPVAAMVPPAPEPPAPPLPVISLTADRTAIAAGESLTLQWRAENATSVQITGIGDVDPAAGQTAASPEESTSFTATARGPGGSATDAVRVTVSERPELIPAPAPSLTLEEEFLRTVADVYFDYDRADVRPDQVEKIDALVRWLNGHSDTRITVEGHGDERGNQEYNIALGDRRASEVRSRLRQAGVNLDRIEIISYGEERPVCGDLNENCWSRNRRAHFVLR